MVNFYFFSRDRGLTSPQKLYMIFLGRKIMKKLCLLGLLVAFSSIAGDWKCFPARWKAIDEDQTELYIHLETNKKGVEFLSPVVLTTPEAETVAQGVRENETICLKGRYLANSGGRSFFAHTVRKD